MNWNKLKNSNKELPESPGRYVWWSRYIGNIPVIWDGDNFKTLSGDVLGKGVVILWR